MNYMMEAGMGEERPGAVALRLPEKRGLFYGGAWHRGGDRAFIENPATGLRLAEIDTANVQDVEAAVAAAAAGFSVWRDVAPLERGRILREMAAVIRAHADELALLDAADSGNPYLYMVPDVAAAAAFVDFFAGLITEVKGSSIPMGPDAVNFSTRQPLGVVARLLAFNHPLMFCAAKSAAILAAGNAVIVKPPEQAPLSALRLAELTGHLFPPGVFNIVPGDRVAGEALVAHPGVAAAALVGSVAAGRAVMRTAAERVKPVVLELGGKNPLIA
ncbi:MAG TPA: aldehyde dehydrogenase family protein, partial [Sphingomonadaceae bacterium]|nr:aldehyde dehydrogenase family protein [Sphingomonadaceae bacterium]